MDYPNCSDIPKNSEERTTRECHVEHDCIWPEIRECLVEGTLVGYRQYDEDGLLMKETPIQNGKKHGLEITWDTLEDTHYLSLTEPYYHGLIHGTAHQFDVGGDIMGTYTLAHGTGFDVWRHYNEQGDIYVAEIHSYKDGLPHGYEWWLNEDQHTIWEETIWYQGKLHGIKRQWNAEGLLAPGYPMFYIYDTMVSKESYLSQSQTNSTLIKYNSRKDTPTRNFPVEIQQLLK